MKMARENRQRALSIGDAMQPQKNPQEVEGAQEPRVIAPPPARAETTPINHEQASRSLLCETTELELVEVDVGVGPNQEPELVDDVAVVEAVLPPETSEVEVQNTAHVDVDEQVAYVAARQRPHLHHEPHQRRITDNDEQSEEFLHPAPIRKNSTSSASRSPTPKHLQGVAIGIACKSPLGSSAATTVVHLKSGAAATNSVISDSTPNNSSFEETSTIKLNKLGRTQTSSSSATAATATSRTSKSTGGTTGPRKMRIRNLVVTLNDASNRRGSQQITVTARDGKDAFHQVHKFAVLLLHSLDNYQLWIYNADFGLRAVLTPEHLESAFLWSGSISVDVYQDGQKPPQLICSSGGLGAGARNSGEQQCSSSFHPHLSSTSPRRSDGHNDQNQFYSSRQRGGPGLPRGEETEGGSSSSSCTRSQQQLQRNNFSASTSRRQSPGHVDHRGNFHKAEAAPKAESPSGMLRTSSGRPRIPPISTMIIDQHWREPHLPQQHQQHDVGEQETCTTMSKTPQNCKNAGGGFPTGKELFHQTKMRMDKTRAGIAARQQAAIATTQNGTMHHDIDNMRGHVVGGVVNAKPEEGDGVKNVNMKMCDVEDVGAGVESVEYSGGATRAGACHQMHDELAHLPGPATHASASLQLTMTNASSSCGGAGTDRSRGSAVVSPADHGAVAGAAAGDSCGMLISDEPVGDGRRAVAAPLPALSNGATVEASITEKGLTNLNRQIAPSMFSEQGTNSSPSTLLQYANTEANASNLSPPGQNTTGGSPSTIDEYAPSLVPSGRTLSTAKANDNGHYGYTMAAGRDGVRGIITPERGRVSSVAGAFKTANANKPQANGINPEKSLAIAEPMYLRKCIVKLQRWVKRTYHNPCRHTSGREKLESMEKLFHSHCDRCNTQGLNWDLVLLHPDPDSLLQEILRKSQLLPDSALMSKGGGKTKKSDLKKGGAGADASCNMLNEYKNSNKIGRNSSSRHHSKGSRTSKSKKTGGGGKSSSRGRKSRLNKREYYPCDQHQQSKDTTVDRSRHSKPVAATAFAINHGTTTTTTTPAAPQATATVSKAGSSKKGSRGGGERERNSTTSLVPANMSSLLSGNYPFGAESCAQLARTASAGVVGKLGGTAALAIGTAAPTSGAMQLGNLSGGGGAQRRNSKELLPPPPSRSTTGGGGGGEHADRVAAVAGGVSAPAAVLGGSGTAIAGAQHAVPHVPTTNGEQLQLRLKKDAANDLSREQKLLKEGQLDTTPMMVGHGSICGEDDDESSSTNGCNMSEILKRPAEECSEISSPREMADDEDSGDESDEGSSSTSEDGSEEEEDSGSSERNVRIDKNGPTRTASLRLSSSQGWKKSSSGGGCKNDLQRSATRTSSRGCNGCPLLQVEPPPRGPTSAGDRAGHDHPATVVSGTTRQNRAIERQRQEQQRREREYLLEQQKQELTARIHAMEEELYMLKKCNLIYILATPLEHQPSASTNKNAFGVLRQRIRNIVLTIGDAFKKRMEQVLYVNERAVSAAGCAGNHHGAAANSAAASNTNSNGGAETRGGAFMPQSCVQVAGQQQLSSSSSFYHQLNNKVHGGPRSSFNSGTNLSTRTSNNLNFQTLVQIYLLISQVVEAYTHLFAGIGGSGSAIELRALSHAEDNLDKWNMVDRIYSGILSDVLEYVEGCLNRFEYLFKSSVLCKKVAELFPYTKFPLDMRQSDWKLYEKGWGGSHGAGASSGFLGSSNLLGVAGGDKQNQTLAGSSSLGRNTGRLLPAPSGSMNSDSPVGAGGHLDTRGTTRTSWSFRNAPNPLDPIPRSLSTLGGLSSTGYSNVNAEPLGGAGGAGLVNTAMLNGNKMYRSQQHNPKSLYHMSGYERLRQKKQWLETQAFVYLKHGRDWGRVRPLNNYVFPLSSHSSQAGGMKMLANQEQNYSSWSTEHQPLEGIRTQRLATVNNATSSHDPIEHHQCRRAQQSFSKYYSVRAGFTGSMIAGVNNFHSMNSTNSDHDTASVLSEKLSAFPWRKDEINAAEKQKLLWKRKCAARGGGPHLGSTRAADQQNQQNRKNRADQQNQREQKPRGCKETDEFVILRLCPSRNFHYSFILAEKPTTLWRTVYRKAMRYYGLDYMELASFRSAIHLIPEEPIGNSNFLQQKLFHSIIVTRPTHMSTVDRVSLDLIRILEEDYALDRSTMQLTLDIPQEYLCLPHIEASRFIADLLVLPFEINTDVAAGQSQGDKVKDRDNKGSGAEAGGENSGASSTMLKTSTSDRATGGGGTAAAGGATSPKSAANNSSSASAYVDQTAGASTTAAFAPPPPRTGRNTPPPLQNQNPSVISTTGAQVANDVTSSVGGNNSNANDVREHSKSVCEYPQFESAELLSGGTAAVHGTNAATGTTGAGRGPAQQEHAHAGAAGKNDASNSASNGKSNATSYTWNHYLQSEIIDPVAALAANATGTGESCHGNAVASVVGGNSFAGPGALFGTKNTTHAGGAGGGNSKSSPGKHAMSSNKSSSKNHHRFYFRNSHFRRCVSIECDYQEFTAWLQFLQHLRRGNRVRQVDLMALNARITFLDVSALCEHIRHLSTKVELFRSLTFGNYVPPGLTSPGAGGGGVGSHLHARVAALPPIVPPGSAGSNNGVLLADFEPASQIMAHQLAAAQPDAAAAGSALAGSFGGICQGMVERQLRRLEDYWLKIDEDKCFQIHLGPDAGNAAMAAFATAPGDGGGSCDGSEKPLLALEDGNAHEDGCEPPNKDAEHSADRSSYGFQTPEKKSTKHKLGRAAVGSGRALDNSRNNTSLDTTHCPLDDSGSTANSLLETSTGDVLMASSEPGGEHSHSSHYHLSPEIKEASMAQSDCAADASVAQPQATPEGSPALRSPDIENAEKRVKNTGDSTSLFVATPDCHRVTDFVSHRVEPLTTAACGGGGAAAAGKGIAIGTRRRQHSSLAASTEEKGPVGAPGSSADAEVHSPPVPHPTGAGVAAPIPNGPEETEPAAANTEAAAPRDTPADSSSSFSSTLQQLLSWNTYTSTKWGSATTNVLKNVFGGGVDLDLHDAQHDNSTRSPSSASSDHGTSGDEVVHFESGSAGRLVGNSDGDAKPEDPPPPSRPGCRVMNAPTRINRQALGGHHPNTCDPLHSGKTETTFKSTLKEEKEKEDRITHYRGTPNVITPAYVLGTTGSSTTNAIKNVADTWLIQKVVSTASTTGGSLFIPGAGAETVPLKHYTFKMDPMRGGLHVIRQHPGSSVTSASTPGRDYIVAPTSLTMSLGVSVGVQTALGLVRNLWTAKEDTKAEDIGRELVKDAGKGACVGTSYWSVLQLINAAQGSSVPSVQFAANCLALNPTPALLGLLGSGWVALRYLMYTQRYLTQEQFLADAVFSGYSNGMGAAACILGASLGFSPAMCAIVGCFMGSGLAAYTYECWREESALLLCRRLRKLAVFTLGLPNQFDEKLLNTRYRTLARYTHPDRNKSPDAKQMFELIQLAREICLNDLSNYEEAKQRLNLLWGYLQDLK